MGRDTVEKVVVVGGGYAGAIAAVRVAGRARARADVTLIEPRKALVQRLRLHQLAAGQDPSTYDLVKLTGRRVAHVRGRAYEIDLDRRLIRTSGSDGAQTVAFDHLILATGSVVDLDRVPGAREHAHSLNDQASAQRLRVTLRHMRSGGLIAVCGGGMTGLEAAAEFAEMRPDVRIVLATSGALGGWLCERGRRELRARLDHLGVAIVDHVRVTCVEPDRLRLGDGAELRVDATVWCGGFVTPALARECGLAVGEQGAVSVDSSLRSSSHPYVVAAGDAAAPPELPNGSAFRMTCQAGMPAGAHAADTVVATLKRRDPEPFDFGYLHQPISLGRRGGLIQFVDRADRPKDRLLTGRRAIVYKELVTRSAVPTIALERRMPGTLRWPSGGAPTVRPALERASSA